MEGLFKVIYASEAYPSQSNPQLMLRDVVLKSFVPRSSKMGPYVGWQSFACSLFGEEAERFTAPAESFISAELSFNARKTQNGGYITRVNIVRHSIMTQQDWARGIERQQSTQPLPNNEDLP